MNKRDASRPDLDSLLKQALKDDIPPGAEARMNRLFRSLKSTIKPTEPGAAPQLWMWGRTDLRGQVLAFASAVLLIGGGVLHLSGNQSVLAHSVERLKMVVTVSAGLRRATSMDCTVRVPRAGQVQSSYHVRWGVAGATRVDMDSSGGRPEQTLWIPDETVSMVPYARIAARPASISGTPRDPVWQPALEFLTPALLAHHMEKKYGLIQARHWDGAGRDEVLLVGQENQCVIEITVDTRTYLPKTLKKYWLNSGRAGGDRTCLEEVGFQWNQPIPRELFVPKSPAQNQRSSIDRIHF
jgi:hypothetical protein